MHLLIENPLLIDMKDVEESHILIILQKGVVQILLSSLKHQILGKEEIIQNHLPILLQGVLLVK